MNHDALAEVLEASRQWIRHFNKGDVDYCVAAYLPDAVMEALPMGEFVGTEQIDDFWRPFVQSGATDLQYQEVWLKQIDDGTVHLGANWSMNVGNGVITLEEWVKSGGGLWKLARDHFEVKEQY
ncbi:MAG: YybH family protein [Endozoicomonas sp.]